MSFDFEPGEIEVLCIHNKNMEGVELLCKNLDVFFAGREREAM